MDNKLNTSIIVPTYNEEFNIDQLVMRIHDAFKANNIKYEIIFIDDFSTDNTWKKITSLKKKYPIKLSIKKGQQGKAFSLTQGFDLAKYDNLCMIDADLQYPPEAIPQMIKKLKDTDIIVANRKIYKTNLIRKFISRSFRTVFGKMIFGLNADIQSGLKVFKKQVWKNIDYTPTEAWAFDLEFLYKAQALGFNIKSYNITFTAREEGDSKVGFIKTIWEIGSNALKVRLKPIYPHHFSNEDSLTMENAGIRFKKKKYVTHTTLPHSTSALKTFHNRQKIFITSMLLLIFFGLIFNTLQTLLYITAILSTIYFIDTLFNLYLVWRSLNFSKEITFTDAEIQNLKDKNLPVYSILCPLYKEAHVIPQFTEAISKLDWPKDKLDAILLLEEDDVETISTVEKMDLPPFIRTVIVPNSQPKTKPKACNYGLLHAKGEYLVIYDAEDMPDPLQLKKAFLGFQKSGDKTICLQAKLNYYNPHQNILTRFFTAEYSLWFDVSLTGLQTLNTSLPLGGTSNHFRINDLHKLQGWDPFNVTEDADLGVRLFKRGFQTAIIDSTTLEEANSKVPNWLRQRSRWIKGYMQTYLVHTRDIFMFSKSKGLHSLYFNLTIGGKIAFILINPLLWLTTISYFLLNQYVGETIEYLYPSVIFYMAAISLVFGNFLYIYYYMIGAIKRQQWELIKFIFFVPLYWLLISIAGYIALFQLIFKPHYWEKTVHGLHLKNKPKKSPEVQKPTHIALPDYSQQKPKFGKISLPLSYQFMKINKIKNYKKIKETINSQRLRLKIKQYLSPKNHYFSGSVLVASMLAGSVLNLVFNAYLGRVLTFETLALVSVINSLQYFTTIPFGALSNTINYRGGFLEKRYSPQTAYNFLIGLKKGLIIISILSSAIWILMTPFLINYFKLQNIAPMLLFAPILTVGFIAAANRGFLTGKLLFISTALLFILEPALKLITVFLLVTFNLPELTYVSIPLSIVGGFIVSVLLVNRVKLTYRPEKKIEQRHIKFPAKFFMISTISSLSTMTFLSLDVILAKHFLPEFEAGQYSLVSLVGKIIFFLTTLFNIFIMPFVSQNEGAKKDSSPILWRSLGVAFILASISFIGIGIFGQHIVPIIFGEKTNSILNLLLPFSFAIACFSLSSVFVSYYLAKKVYSFSASTFMLALLQIVFIEIFHSSPYDIVMVMLFIGYANLITVTILHLNANTIINLENNFRDLVGIFSKNKELAIQKNNSRILILNWRDIKHKWAGGAEVYIHEIAKRWAKEGSSVTIFSGNDGKTSRNQTIDGIQIIRRGGFYTVYFWAFIYYIFKFKGKFDIIIDSANGIPFLTPLYVRKPIYLLIHHIHQDVFRSHLPRVLSFIASVVEGKIMPVIYKNNKVITVSESSKKDIIKIGFSSINEIHVVNPGIDNSAYFQTEKTKNPSVIYLGRIKPYKNINHLIEAFSKIVKTLPEAKLFIAGDGEHLPNIKNLVNELKLNKNVKFLGKVTEEDKIKLLGTSWVAVQPSQVEGWGITVIEANACNTPVIASNVSGLKDSIVNGKTGILFKPGNTEKLYEALASILTTKDLRDDLSREAYMWSQNFSWDKSANKFYGIILNDDSQKEFEVSANLVLRNNLQNQYE